MHVNVFIFAFRNTFHKSNPDRQPHVSIALLDAKQLSIAKSGARFEGVNIHMYVKGPSPEWLYNPQKVALADMAGQNITIFTGFNSFGWKVVLQAAQHRLAITDSIAVERPRGVRKPALAWIGEFEFRVSKDMEVIRVIGKYAWRPIELIHFFCLERKANCNTRNHKDGPAWFAGGGYCDVPGTKLPHKRAYLSVATTKYVGNMVAARNIET
jgi:hypothetical protein